MLESHSDVLFLIASVGVGLLSILILALTRDLLRGFRVRSRKNRSFVFVLVVLTLLAFNLALWGAWGVV
jgi:hypothetical protein